MGTHRYDPIRVFEYTQRPTPIPIRVLSALVSQPLVLLDKAGRLEKAAYTQPIRNGWHIQTTSNKQTCALSQFYDWLIRKNVRVIDSWLLLSLPAGGGSTAWWWPRPVLRRLCNLTPASPWQSPSTSLPSNPLPYHGPLNSTHAWAHGGRVTGCLNALWSSCVLRNAIRQQLMNLQWCM